MLTATYNIPACDWTEAIDAALSMWSPHIHESTNLDINVVFDDTISGLAVCRQADFFRIGSEPDGDHVLMTYTAYKLMSGRDLGPVDMTIAIDPTEPWDFSTAGPVDPNSYSAVTTMAHELGHALFMVDLVGSDLSPFDFYSAGRQDIDGDHFDVPGPMMYGTLSKGARWSITQADIDAMAGSGIATAGDDTLYLPFKGLQGMVTIEEVDGGAGTDLLVCYDDFDTFDARPLTFTDIEALRFDGADPLTSDQEGVFRLYSAAFDRTPDLGGFTFWANCGLPIEDIADAFVGSTEFQSIYGGGTFEDFVTALYQNVLDREPDQAGLDYWASQEALGEAPVLTAFALSAENAVGVVEIVVA